MADDKPRKLDRDERRLLHQLLAEGLLPEGARELARTLGHVEPERDAPSGDTVEPEAKPEDGAAEPGDRDRHP
jgi:hypothetical protein